MFSRYPYSLSIVVFFLVFFSFSFLSAADFQQYRPTTRPRISSGAAFNRALQNGKIHPIPSPAESWSDQSLHKNTVVSGTPLIVGPVTEAINYSHDDSLNGWGQTPPDNAACIGPNHFLLAVNTAIEWYTKMDRIRQYSESLNTFFAATSPSDLFDPRVLWDQYNNRYIVLADEENDNSKISYIHIAVSKTDDPNDGWNFQRVNTKLNIDGTDTWLDFPSLGVSTDAFYLNGNMFTFSSTYKATRMWIFDKGLYGSDTSSYHVYDPSTEAGLANQAFTIQPAHMYGSQPNGDGLFMFSSEWDDNNGNNDMIAVFRIDDPLGASGGPQFNVQFVNPGEIHDNSSGVPSAPQLGSDVKIDFGDDRAQSCVWRGDTLVGTFTVNPSSGSQAGQATDFWFTVNTSTFNNLQIGQQGFIEGDDIADATYTGFPAISINQNGDIAIGFSASAATIYAGAYFAVHQATDPAGTIRGSQEMHPGEDYYVRTGLPIHIGNRWGDYSSIALDPVDTTHFWVYNQYAWTRGDSDAFAKEAGRWATAFAQIDPDGTPSALKNHEPIATRFSLEQNYPNPFGQGYGLSGNPSTSIRYSLAGPLRSSDRVRLIVYNTLGQRVKELVNTHQQAGNYSITFDGAGLATGVYFYQLITSRGVSEIKKMILIR